MNPSEQGESRRHRKGHHPPSAAGSGGDQREAHAAERGVGGNSHVHDAGGDLWPEVVDDGVEAGERVELELRRRLLQHRQ
jgi:hypothetical protein